ncbi:hypothetical protein QCN29_01220 [Streptomyces sp. HNM0663]|uniref:Uncharacterized protein n=1 Tax=Streptomyces chengmaiensis TaxID=3040919 RepID=A0ABT6HF88_9ACTN|nr:hypothetical protein [Streptomyces chengmaiensis]MDH2387427.1 hypothetical protein [Streptomyces chengmaiensis]
MRLHELERRLAEAVRSHESGNAQALPDAMHSLAEPEVPHTLVHNLRAAPERLSSAAERSYLHANGFTKIVLLAGESYKLRLHLWWPDATPGGRHVEDIHDHRWDFASCLLAGSYRYQEFHAGSVASGASAETYHAYTYRSPGGGSSFPLTSLGRRRLRCVFDATLTAGTSYVLRAEVPHRVISDPGRFTASLMLQCTARRSRTYVYSTRDLGSGVHVPITRLTPDDLDGQLCSYLAHTGGAPDVRS